LGSGKVVQQAIRSLRGECFAAEKKTPEAWKHCLCKFVFNQAHLRKRWRRDPDGGTGIRKGAIKHSRIRHKIAAYAEEGPARGKAAKQIHHREIE
jgi:hypothetical protein